MVAGGIHRVIGWSWQASFVFGSLIAAEDSVSGGDEGGRAEPRLRFIIRGRAIVNDGAAAALFRLCVGFIDGATAATPSEVAMSLIPTVLGGIFFGVVIAGALRLLAGRSDDHLVELTSTVLAAYGSSSRPGGQDAEGGWLSER
jgi:monovalent cation:H+ antiporter, CPA1 family